MLKNVNKKFDKVLIFILFLHELYNIKIILPYILQNHTDFIQLKKLLDIPTCLESIGVH